LFQLKKVSVRAALKL